MPSYNFTIADSSPYISYMPAGAWGDSDLATASYTNGTFHFTNQAAYLQFSFNGTGVSLHGAYRDNHGLYTVTVDGGHIFTGNGGGHGNVFNQTLFQLGGLPYGTHTIKLTNEPGPNHTYVDLDWAVVEVGDAHANTPNDDIWVDDAAGNWTYDATFAASTNQLSPQYYDQTFHATSTDGAKATLHFYGNAVSLYGATSSNHGPYHVSLDGGAAQQFNGSQVHFRPQQMLYMASGLPTGMHTVVLTNVGGAFTDVDYAIVSRYGAAQGTGAPSGTPSASGGASSSGSASASVGYTSISGASVEPITGTGTATAPGATATSLGDNVGSSSAPSASAPSSSTSSAGRRSRVGAATLGALALCSLLVAAL